MEKYTHKKEFTNIYSLLSTAKNKNIYIQQEPL